MSAATITRTYTEQYDEMRCGGCSIVFYVPEAWKAKKISESGSFSCPNGCSRHYTGESDADRARRLFRELAAAKSAQEFAERRLTDAQARHEKEVRRIQRRQAAGVCPCCHRTVSQMARHMKTKHPEFGA